ncbi:hypothetical protein [Marinitenerispora sediminis]|uniref:DUF2178 domain-containing protein n=1 Tax=Marinitenerispora sediminis TaxID=1931232 RepID=A0A368TAJ1_9ACTN|nr:hypothetical protein [Marinitenerispora sediminis]RCV55890.1 hypothetical protein DEF28_04905 [Marinitenerispora sediminis]RCV61987.1 hypothetical protein DEF24_02835 [Marinitenerispora sediminis]RCV62020.1 hypothetical protein DEF23_00655 [Marinitenerispora sediminis]
MSTTSQRWLLASGLVLIGGAFTAFTFWISANWVMPTLLAAVAWFGLWRVFRTHLRPGEASDSERLAAGKRLDERDRALNRRVFAIVGLVALPLSLVCSYAVLLFDSLDARQVVHAQFLVVMLAWAMAGGHVLRRH